MPPPYDPISASVINSICIPTFPSIWYLSAETGPQFALVSIPGPGHLLHESDGRWFSEQKKEDRRQDPWHFTMMLGSRKEFWILHSREMSIKKTSRILEVHAKYYTWVKFAGSTHFMENDHICISNKWATISSSPHPHILCKDDTLLSDQVNR